jgi:transcriptional regulator with XRE-family HTH domain
VSHSTAQLEALARVRIAAANGDLRRIRQAAGLTLREIAGAIGVSGATVHSWEHGRLRPTGKPALALAELLDRLAAITADTEPAA